MQIEIKETEDAPAYILEVEMFVFDSPQRKIVAYCRDGEICHLYPDLLYRCIVTDW